MCAILMLYNMLLIPCFLSCRSHCVTSVLKGADGLPVLIYPSSIKEHHVTFWICMECVFYLINWLLIFIADTVTAPYIRIKWMQDTRKGGGRHKSVSTWFMLDLRSYSLVSMCEPNPACSFNEAIGEDIRSQTLIY